MAFQRRLQHELDRLSDEELIAYAVEAREAGDLDAMREALSTLVFRRYDDTVRRARLKVPAKDAEDVASQALIDTAMAAFKGESEGEFWKLLSVILKRRIADYLEKKKRRLDETALPEEHADDDDIHGGPAAVTPDPTIAIGAQDIIDQLLDKLNDSHRRVVELFVLLGCDAKETAERVNEAFPNLKTPMSVDNVHQIASRFRDHLREALESS